MTVNIYDTARVRFATAGMSWVSDGFYATIPKLGYVPDYRNHTAVSQIQPARGGSVVNLVNKAVDAGGWFICDAIFFASSPVNELVERISIVRFDGVLVFDISFQPFTSPTGKPFRLIRGLSRPGIARL